MTDQIANTRADHALRLAQKVIAQDFFPRLLRQNRDRVGKGGVAEQDGLTADGKWVFLVRLRRGKLDKLLVHQIVKGNLPFPLPFKLQNLVQGGTADNSLAKGVVPALDIFLIGWSRSTAGRHIQLALQRLREEMGVSRYE